MLRHLGVRLSPVQAQELLAVLDGDGRGVIAQADFLAEVGPSRRAPARHKRERWRNREREA